MLSIEDIKEIMDDPSLSDSELEAIRDEGRALVEVIFDHWRKEKAQELRALENNTIEF